VCLIRTGILIFNIDTDMIMDDQSIWQNCYHASFKCSLCEGNIVSEANKFLRRSESDKLKMINEDKLFNAKKLKQTNES